MEGVRFDPTRYLRKVNGNDYLEVKWRVYWLRQEAPESQIVTEMLEYGPDFALCKAVVTRIQDGIITGVATGYGSETPKDFKDHIEKCESKAIGRALGHLGYGTQFVDSEADSGRIVDAPVQRPVRNMPAEAPSGPVARSEPAQATNSGIPPLDQRSGPEWDAPATERQIRYLEAVAREAGIDKPTLNLMTANEFGVGGYGALNKRSASILIERIQAQDIDVPVLAPA